MFFEKRHLHSNFTGFKPLFKVFDYIFKETSSYYLFRKKKILIKMLFLVLPTFDLYYQFTGNLLKKLVELIMMKVT